MRMRKKLFKYICYVSNRRVLILIKCYLALKKTSFFYNLGYMRHTDDVKVSFGKNLNWFCYAKCIFYQDL